MRKAQFGSMRRTALGITSLAFVLHVPTALAQTVKAPETKDAPPPAPGTSPASSEKPAAGAEKKVPQAGEAKSATGAAADPAKKGTTPSSQPSASAAPVPADPSAPGAGASAPPPAGSGSADANDPAPATGSPNAPVEPGASEASDPESSGARAGQVSPPLGQDSTGFGLFQAEGAAPPSEPSAEDAAATDAAKEKEGSSVFAEDWWTHTRPTLELHGNFRVRSQLYHHFALGRIDPASVALWPRPGDDAYSDLSGTEYGARVCTPREAQTGTSNATGDANQGCINPTQAGANLRFRLEPSIIISDNLRVISQIDLLDNLVLGSTAQGYSNFPGATGYGVQARDGYAPYSGVVTTQNPPVSGINSLSDSIVVKRAWAEYETPLGQARFGRMPDHFGLGLHHNAGDDLDGDFQSTVDRLAFVTGLPSLFLYAAGAWDFPYEGATSAAFTSPGVPAYDLAQYDDVSQMNLILFRKIDPAIERLMLAKGQLVVNGGLYLTYAFQRIANDVSGASATCDNGAQALDCAPDQVSAGYARRGMEVITPDVYAEVKYKKFRFATEVVTHQGTLESVADLNLASSGATGQDFRINQWGFASEVTQYLVEDRLKLGFFFGWASGDGDVDGLTPNGAGSVQLGDNSIDTFRFHPGYRVDLILNRHILSRVQGSYYLKPMAQYDFIRDKSGMKLGGRAEAIWTRASNFMQTPGHNADLGIELNASVYFQSKDGSLNDDPDLVGGLYTMLQYGVLFPMSGLGYQSEERPAGGGELPGLETAQTVRLFLGVAY